MRHIVQEDALALIVAASFDAIDVTMEINPPPVTLDRGGVDRIGVDPLTLVLEARELDRLSRRTQYLQRGQALVDRCTQAAYADAAPLQFEDRPSIDLHRHSLRDLQRQPVAKDCVPHTATSDFVSGIVG